jgi:hypothetical protein
LAKCQAGLSEIRAHLAQADEKHTQLQTSRDEIARLLEAAEFKLKLANDQISSLSNVLEDLNARISSLLASRPWQIRSSAASVAEVDSWTITKRAGREFHHRDTKGAKLREDREIGASEERKTRSTGLSALHNHFQKVGGHGRFFRCAHHWAEPGASTVVGERFNSMGRLTFAFASL